MGTGTTFSNDDQSLELRFKSLALTCENESEFSSNSAVVHLSSYRKIISMGGMVVPLILKELQKPKSSPYYWFAALSEITGENPVPPEHVGRLRLMDEDWLKWGHEKGLI